MMFVLKNHVRKSKNFMAPILWDKWTSVTVISCSKYKFCHLAINDVCLEGVYHLSSVCCHLLSLFFDKGETTVTAINDVCLEGVYHLSSVCCHLLSLFVGKGEECCPAINDACLEGVYHLSSVCCHSLSLFVGKEEDYCCYNRNIWLETSFLKVK